MRVIASFHLSSRGRLNHGNEQLQYDYTANCLHLGVASELGHKNQHQRQQIKLKKVSWHYSFGPSLPGGQSCQVDQVVRCWSDNVR